MNLSSRLSFKEIAARKEMLKHNDQYQVKLKEEILERHNMLSFVITELFDINDNCIQHSPPLALMETSNHSPPLKTMAKDKLLCLSNISSFNFTWY